VHAGYKVTVFDVPGGCVHPRAGGDVAYTSGDMTSIDALRGAFAGAVLVVHAAPAPPSCTDPVKIEAINLGGTRAVVDAAKACAVRALVYSSSSSVVFEGEALTDVDETQPYPSVHVDAATETRARAEAFVLAAATPALGTAAIRSSILYGQLDPSFVPGLVAAAYCGASRVVLGGGRNFADFVYAENAAHAHLLAADALLSAEPARRKAVSGEAFFVSDGEPQPFWRVCGLLLSGLGYSAPWLRVPAFLGGLLLGGLSAQSRAFASAHHYASTAKAARVLGYVAPVAPDAAIAATVAHFKHLRCGAHGRDVLRALFEVAATALLLAALAHAALLAPHALAARAAEELARALAAPAAQLAGAGVPQAHLVLLAGGLSLALHVLGALLPNARPMAVPRVLPPTIAGKPLLGNLIDFLKGPLDLIAVARKHHRNIFTLKIGPQPITFCCHPDGYETFGRGKDDVLDQAAVYGFTIPAFGKNVVYDAPLDKRLQQIQFVAAIMNTSTMRSYVPKIIMEAEAFFATWGESGEKELHEEIAHLTTLTASRCLHGHEVRETLHKQVADLYHDIDGGMQPISTILPYLPIAAHRRRDRAREELARLFGERARCATGVATARARARV
jgi:nucleoside-diphosphate-sugar epimerase